MALGFNISLDWKEIVSDGEPCRRCQEPIKGRMYRMELTAGEDKEWLNYRLCQPCYQNMIDESDNNKNG